MSRNLNSFKFLTSDYELNNNSFEKISKTSGVWSGSEAYSEGPFFNSFSKFDSTNCISLNRLILPTDGSKWSFALSFIVKSYAGSEQVLLSQGTNGADGRSYLAVNGRYLYFLNQASGFMNILNGNMELNTFYRVVVTNDGSGNLTGFLNGSKIVTDTGCSNVQNKNGLIGSLYHANGIDFIEKFVGMISSVKIWNLNLTSDEVLKEFLNSNRVKKK